MKTQPDALRQIRVVLAGDVDHGKSTLIGRLLYETGSLTADRVEGLKKASDRRGDVFEWSFALDALQSERDQAVTVDTTRVWLRLPDVEIVLIDAPGHEQFLRNMVTGSSDAQVALLVVDATLGVTEQTRRHLLLLELLGIERCIVAVNKMDLLGYRQESFDPIETTLRPLLTQLGIVPLAIVPIAARGGENLARPSTLLAWHPGPTLLEALRSIALPAVLEGASLRMFVQGVIRENDRRIMFGNVDAGSLQVGSEVVILPSRERTTIASIEVWPAAPVQRIGSGHAAAFTLEGQRFVDRGDLLADTDGAPELERRFAVRLAWLGQTMLRSGARFDLRVGTRIVGAQVEAIDRVVDPASLAALGATAARYGDLVDAKLHLAEPVAFDASPAGSRLRRFIALRDADVIGAGQLLRALSAATGQRVLFPPEQFVTPRLREHRNGHAGTVIWLTGLPASGKSTLAAQWERSLFDRHRQVYVLDGDRVRGGLCSDLGFSAEDRSENIRRVSEVAALFCDAGFVVIAAFISPNRIDREIARRVVGERFREVYIKADLAACERRDPKGLYARARSGGIANFTGIGAEYEPPAQPDLIIDTTTEPIDQSVERGLRFIESVLGTA
ncbi:MAG: adenylyl-sulfate kinase [Vulcanimicrobiaceae bacterium]